MSKKKVAKKEMLTCFACGKEKDTGSFYTSFSPFHAHTSRLHACKQCVQDSVEDGNLNSFMNMLRRFDKPFVTHLYESAIQKNAYVGEYFKLINAKDFLHMTWENSDFDGHRKTKEIEKSAQVEPELDFSDEVTTYWGRGYDDSEYSFLEEERHKLMSSFECPDYGMEMIMKDICFINLDIEKIRQERKPNSGKEITALIKTRSDLMNDANMKPIQATGAEGNDQITFGTLIKKWENERPVPKPLEDEMKEYIDTFMVGHLAKMEGLNNDLTEKYDKALSKYTIDFNEINKNDEEYED